MSVLQKKAGMLPGQIELLPDSCIGGHRNHSNHQAHQQTLSAHRVQLYTVEEEVRCIRTLSKAGDSLGERYRRLSLIHNKQLGQCSYI